MKYLLDTNICIYVIKKNPISVISKLKKFDIFEIGVSSITLSELEYGIEKSNFPEQNRIALIEFLSPIKIVSCDSNAAMYYGKIRTTLEKQGTPIGSLDLLIAAHALSLNSILITNNVKEFNRIENLQLENWV